LPARVSLRSAFQASVVFVVMSCRELKLTEFCYPNYILLTMSPYFIRIANKCLDSEIRYGVPGVLCKLDIENAHDHVFFFFG
jgi:hypothetical protein